MLKYIASSNQVAFYKREKAFSKPYMNMIYLYKVNNRQDFLFQHQNLK